MQVSVDLKYENYIFDLYGTLIDIHTEEGERKLWKGCRGCNERQR